MADDWGQYEHLLKDESVSEKEVKEAESGPQVPLGKYLCTCLSTKPREVKFDDRTAVASSTKWRIDKVIEVGEVANGKVTYRKANPGELEDWEGRFIFDDVFLPADDEKESAKNRRTIIAVRTGIIPNSGGTIPRNAFTHLIVNKQAILALERQTWKDKKTGEDRVAHKVGFAGYDYAAKANQMSRADIDKAIADL